MKLIQGIDKICILFLIIIITSCYKNEEGCLDQYANNLSFTADDPCEDCCKYPSFKVSYQHKFDSLSMKLNDTLSVDSLSFFNIISISYYISEMELEIDSGYYEVLDSITYVKDDIMLKVSSNNLLLNGLRSNSTVFTIKGDAKVNKCSFNIGLPQDWAIDNFETTSTSNVLNEQSAQTLDGNYCNFKLKLIKGASLNDTIEMNLCDAYFPFKFDSENLGEITKGKDYNNLVIEVQYKELFKNIDFNNIDSLSLKLKLEENIPDVFNVY